MRSRILIIGLIAMTLVLVIPPWHFWINTASIRRSLPAPRSPIFDPPLPMKWVKYSNAERWEVDESKSVGIDFGRLFIEWAGIASLTVIALLVRRRFKNED